MSIDPKKPSTTKVSQDSMGVSFKSANKNEFPIVYTDDAWHIVSSADDPLYSVTGATGQFTQEQINNALAENRCDVQVQDAIIIPYSISLNVSELHQKAYIHIPDGYVATPIAGGNTGCGYVHCFCNGYKNQSYSGWDGTFAFSIKTWEFHYHKGQPDWSLPWNQTGWFKKQLTCTTGGSYGYTFCSFYYPSPDGGSNGYFGMVGDIEIEVTAAISDSIGETNALIFGSLYCVKNSKIPPVSQMTDYTTYNT